MTTEVTTRASQGDPSGGLAIEEMLRMYETMLLIRHSEERLADLLVAAEVKCPTHLYTGQEAIATGVCSSLGRHDYVFGGHRSHGHYLAKGGGLKEMFAEIYGKSTGCAKGRGGSMHLLAPEVGILGTVPLVAATIPLAVGTALASTLRSDGRVTVSFFGDGAVEEGGFHESMNLAAAHNLPVIFVCENNFYSSHLHLFERRAADNIVASAGAHGMPGVALDGNDVIELRRVAAEAVARARDGGGPSFLECRTYRWRGHVGPSMDLDVGVKRRDELAEWQARDPILRLRAVLLACGSNAAKLDRLQEGVERQIEQAVTFARASSLPDPAELEWYVFAPEEGLFA